MLSKNKIKYIRSLELKKNRKKDGVFVAEGPKVVQELLTTMRAETIVATGKWIAENLRQAEDGITDPRGAQETIEVSEDELRKVSFLQHPQEVLAIFRQQPSANLAVFPEDQLVLALDGVQDPGNLGTIVRIADWFGIRTIYCSMDTADIYNPKVVQATMGSIARVQLVYTDLAQLIDRLPATYPVYGTFLDGEDIYRQTLTPNGLIVMGNEGKGVSPEIRQRANKRLLIPPFPHDKKTAESLNVAVATAVICSEFRRTR